MFISYSLHFWQDDKVCKALWKQLFYKWPRSKLCDAAAFAPELAWALLTGVTDHAVLPALNKARMLATQRHHSVGTPLFATQDPLVYQNRNQRPTFDSVMTQTYTPTYGYTFFMHRSNRIVSQLRVLARRIPTALTNLLTQPLKPKLSDTRRQENNYQESFLILLLLGIQTVR